MLCTMKRSNREAGFTLLELFIVVLAIIILLLIAFFMRVGN